MQIAAVHRPSYLSWIVGAVALATIAVESPTPVASSGAGPAMQAAVTEDGFAVMASNGEDRRVISVDGDGARQWLREIPLRMASARMVGTNRGVGVAWIYGEKVSFARLKGDHELGRADTFGKRVGAFCDGVATSSRQWGIGWLEKDGRVWVLHGPVRGGRTVDGEVVDFADPASGTTRNTWCAVTSTGRGEALIWRDGAYRYWLNQCDSKGCSDKVLRLPVTKKLDLEAIACTKSACLIVANEAGRHRAIWWKVDGKVASSTPIGDATEATAFQVAAAGDSAFALAYVGREGAVVQRVIASGSMERAWADPASTEVPAIAWAGDKLFVAQPHGRDAVTHVLALPR